MKFTVRFTPEAKDDLVRLYAFLLETNIALAEKALEAIKRGISFLHHFPQSCRKATSQNSNLRELLISFGKSGYVVLFEIEEYIVTILAIRHQRENDYL